MRHKKGQLGNLTQYAVGFLALVLVIVLVAMALPILRDSTATLTSFSYVNETINATIGVPVTMSYTMTAITKATTFNYTLNTSEYGLVEGKFNLTSPKPGLNNSWINVTYTYTGNTENTAKNITSKGIASIELFGDWFKILIILVTVIGIILGIRFFKGGSGGGF
jgi:hypothetical protein